MTGPGRLAVTIAALSCCLAAAWHSHHCARADSQPQPSAQNEPPSAVEVLQQASRQLTRLARLEPATDIACDIEGPARYVSDQPLQRPQDMLFDRIVVGQGIFADGDEPLAVRLTFPAGQYIQCVQLLYAGTWRQPGIPEVPIIEQTPTGESRQVGLLPPIGAAPPSEPYIQQVTFGDDDQRSGQGWRRLLLTIGGLPESLGLVEIRLIGHDAALRSVAGAAHQLSQQPQAITPGTLSQIAAAVRARRLAEDKVGPRDDILRQLSSLVSQMSGVSAILSIPEQQREGNAVPAEVAVHNRSAHLVEQAVVRLQLPPGWGAAPARMAIEQLPAGESIFLPVTLRPGKQSQQQPSAYMYGAYNAEPLFVLAEVRTAEHTEPQ